MRCRNCEYPLWGLVARVCPECGEAFRPSEYEFVANSVQFCCPHCRQAYYGTDPRGQLVPSQFDCVNCGRHIHVDEMILLPAQGEGEHTVVEHMPWLDRQKRGSVRAWFSTVGMSLIHPIRLMRLVPVHSSSGSALWFATLSTLPCVTTWLILFLILTIWLVSRVAGRGGMSIMGFGGFIFLLAIVLGILVFLSIWAMVAHLILRITGGTATGFSRTYQAFCYGAAANVILAVPCLGFHLAPVAWTWWAVSSILMLKEGQKVHGGRATLATLTLPLLVVLLVSFGIFAFVSNVSSASFPTSAPSGSMVSSVIHLHNEEVRAMGDEVRKYAAAHDGRGPVHAAELVMNGQCSASQFAVLESNLNATEIHIGRLGLDELGSLTSRQQKVILNDLAVQCPPGTVAHRLGDYVFTYHGMDVRKATPRLWLVILAPRSVQEIADGYGQASGRIPAGVTAFRVDGRADFIKMGDLPSRLQSQNAARARFKLPPLPDPMTVTASQPAGSPESVPSP